MGCVEILPTLHAACAADGDDIESSRISDGIDGDCEETNCCPWQPDLGHAPLGG